LVHGKEKDKKIIIISLFSLLTSNLEFLCEGAYLLAVQ